MIFFYGRRIIKVRKYHDYELTCENCKSHHQIFHVYQEYYHFMFIPFFPSGVKAVRCSCADCKDSFNQEKKNEYLSKSKTPFYLYSGIILIVGLIIFGVIMNNYTQNQKSEYVNDPKIGDVYLIKEYRNDSAIYYYVKIKDIKSDTIEMLHNALEYYGHISRMDKSDYFVKDDIVFALKSELKQFLEDEIIKSVERDYSSDSRFNIEK